MSLSVQLGVIQMKCNLLHCIVVLSLTQWYMTSAKADIVKCTLPQWTTLWHWLEHPNFCHWWSTGQTNTFAYKFQTLMMIFILSKIALNPQNLPTLGIHQNDLCCGQHHVNGFVQDCSNSIANTLEWLQSCTKPSMSCCSGAICAINVCHHQSNQATGSGQCNALVLILSLKDRAHLSTFKIFICEKFSCFIVLVVFLVIVQSSELVSVWFCEKMTFFPNVFSYHIFAIYVGGAADRLQANCS